MGDAAGARDVPLWLVAPAPVWHCAAVAPPDYSTRLREHAREQFARLPPGVRRQVLHGLGRYAPWESGFDFTPPPLGPGEAVGPPDFVGIGVQKGGTTWWYDLLMTHPRLYARADIHKERHYFDRFGAEAVGLPPDACVFVDDLPFNLPPAAALGTSAPTDSAGALSMSRTAPTEAATSRRSGLSVSSRSGTWRSSASTTAA